MDERNLGKVVWILTVSCTSAQPSVMINGTDRARCVSPSVLGLIGYYFPKTMSCACRREIGQWNGWMEKNGIEASAIYLIQKL